MNTKQHCSGTIRLTGTAVCAALVTLAALAPWKIAATQPMPCADLAVVVDSQASRASIAAARSDNAIDLLAQGRLLLHAGRVHPAAEAFGRLWEASPLEEKRAQAAFYLGLCDEAQGNVPQAQVWYAKSDCSPTARRLGADAAYFEAFAGHRQSHGQGLGQGMALLEVIAPTSVITANRDRVGQVVAQIQTSRREFQSQNSVENQIRLGSWLLMFAEIAAEKPDLALWSRAVDAFYEGADHLRQVQAAIDKDAGLEKRISTTPAIAMRLDAARVRKEQIEKRQQLARKEELERLRQLRLLAGAYRDLVRHMASSQYQSAMANYPAAKGANAESLKAIDRIESVAKVRKDLYLLADEPALDAEFRFLDAVPAPLAGDLATMVKSVQAVSALRMAQGNPAAPDAALLAEAETQAKAVLESPAASAPGAAPGGVVLAHWVLGVVKESLGALAAKAGPTKASTFAEAAKLYDDSKASLGRAAECLKAMDAKEATVAGLARDVKQQAAALGSSAPALAAAGELTLRGACREAWESLGKAVLRHRQGDLWLARADAGRRAKLDAASLIAELEKAAADGVFTNDDYRYRLTHAALVLAEVAPQLVGGKTKAETNAALAAPLAARLATEEDALRRAAALAGNDERTRPQVQAHLALAIGYRGLVDAKARSPERLKEGYRVATEAQAACSAVLGKSEDPLEKLALREALIASRLALGHLAVQVLPDYRDEPMLAFAAAIDEAARLPFANVHLGIVGSPMIAAVAGRANDSATKLALEERQYRQAVCRFVEGALTLHLGGAETSAQQIADALRTFQSSGATQLVAADAAELLKQADGVDVRMTLRESLRAFGVLANVSAGKTNEAVQQSLDLLLPDRKAPAAASADKRNNAAGAGNAADTVDAGEVARAVSQIQSPLVGYALVAALEQYCVKRQSPSDPHRDALLAQARAAQARTKELFRSQPLQDRFPHLAALNDRAGGRLADPKQYMAGAQQARQRGDLDAAISQLTEAAVRHSSSRETWAALMDVQILRLQSRGATPEACHALLEQMTQLAAGGMLAGFDHQYARGLLYEQMGQASQALAAYQDAVKLAGNPAQRAKANAKAAGVMVRMISARG